MRGQGGGGQAWGDADCQWSALRGTGCGPGTGRLFLPRNRQRRREKKNPKVSLGFVFSKLRGVGTGSAGGGRRGGAARSLRGPRRWEARRSRGGSGAASPWLQQTGPDAFVSRHVFREKHNSTAERGQEKEHGWKNHIPPSPFDFRSWKTLDDTVQKYVFKG